MIHYSTLHCGFRQSQIASLRDWPPQCEVGLTFLQKLSQIQHFRLLFFYFFVEFSTACTAAAKTDYPQKIEWENLSFRCSTRCCVNEALHLGLLFVLLPYCPLCVLCFGALLMKNSLKRRIYFTENPKLTVTWTSFVCVPHLERVYIM